MRHVMSYVYHLFLLLDWMTIKECVSFFSCSHFFDRFRIFGNSSRNLTSSRSFPTSSVGETPVCLHTADHHLLVATGWYAILWRVVWELETEHFFSVSRFVSEFVHFCSDLSLQRKEIVCANKRLWSHLKFNHNKTKTEKLTDQVGPKSRPETVKSHCNLFDD